MQFVLIFIVIAIVWYILDGVFSSIGRYLNTLPGFMTVFFSAIIIIYYFVIRKIAKNYFKINDKKFKELINDMRYPKSIKNYFESLDEAKEDFMKAYKMRFFVTKLYRELAKTYKELIDIQERSKEEFIMGAIKGSYNYYHNLVKNTGIKYSDDFSEEISTYSYRFVGKNQEYANTCLRLLQVYEKIAGSIFDTDSMEGHDFEYWCADLLKKNGFTGVEVTKGSGDQGVDIIAIKESIRYAVQCKCYTSNLGNGPVQEVHAGKAIYQCQIGAVMTNRYFTQGAKELAEATGVLLWDRDKLCEMLETRRD